MAISEDGIRNLLQAIRRCSSVFEHLQVICTSGLSWVSRKNVFSEIYEENKLSLSAYDFGDLNVFYLYDGDIFFYKKMEILKVLKEHFQLQRLRVYLLELEASYFVNIRLTVGHSVKFKIDKVSEEFTLSVDHSYSGIIYSSMGQVLRDELGLLSAFILHAGLELSTG